MLGRTVDLRITVFKIRNEQ